MGISQRQGPRYFHSPTSSEYKSNYEDIFKKQTTNMSTESEDNKNPTEVTPEPAKRKRGRPKGSKNKPKVKKQDADVTVQIADNSASVSATPAAPPVEGVTTAADDADRIVAENPAIDTESEDNDESL